MDKNNFFQSGAISLSFDDGWRSIYDNGLPILEKSGLKSTHYIISSCLDDEQFPRYMSMDHVRDLEKRGHEIGCHTVSHKHLLEESLGIIEEEIVLSKKFLEKRGFSVETLAYPYGEYNEEIIRVVQRAGFRGARTIVEGFNTEIVNPFLLECQAVKVKTSLADIKSWIDQAITNNVWLILMFHQIDNEGREWSATPKMLAEITDYLVRSKIKCITVREGIKLLK